MMYNVHITDATYIQNGISPRSTSSDFFGRQLRRYYNWCKILSVNNTFTLLSLIMVSNSVSTKIERGLNIN